MALFDKKQSINRIETRIKPEDASPPREVKKDISGFEGKPYVRKQEVDKWLRRPERFTETGIPEARRIKLGDRLKPYGDYFDRTKGEGLLKQLEKEEYHAPTGKEKKDINIDIKLLRKFLGK